MISRKMVALALLLCAGRAWAVDGARPAEAKPAEIDASNLSKPPKLLKAATPEYPAAALAKGAAGEVVLLIGLDEKGEVSSASVLTPSAEPGLGFEDAATMAAYQLQFSPAEMAGRPVAVQLTYTFKFLPPKPAPVATPVPVPATPVAPETLSAPARQPIRNFSGVLLERGTRNPLSGIIVTAYRNEDGKPAGFESTTNAEGAFEFFDLDNGPWKVLVEVPGYYPFRTVEEIRPNEAVNAKYFVERGSYSAFDIVVSAPRPQKEVSRVVIDAAIIDKTPGAMGDALAVIQNYAGVARVAGMTGEIIVRGSAPKDTKVFVEGVEIPLVYHFGGLRSVIPTGMIENLQFYPGNFSPYYGRANGGAIDIDLKKPKEKKWHGYLDVNLLDSGLYLEMPFTEKFTLQVAARRSYIDYILNAVIPDSAPIKMIQAPKYYDYQVLASYRPTAAHDLRLFLFASDDRFAMIFKDPGALGTQLDGNQISTGMGFRKLMFSERYVPSEKFENTLRLSYGSDFIKFKFAQFTEDLTNTATQLRDTARWQLSSLFALTGGADLIMQHWTGFVRMPTPSREGEDQNQTNLAKYYETKVDEWHYLPGAFAELEIAPVKRLLILPGLRFDYFSKIKSSTIAPRLTARYGINDHFTVKGGLGLYYQEPSVDESNEGFGNPKLKPERALHSSLGAEWRPTKWFTLDTTGFYKQLDSLVSRTNATEVVDGKTQELRYDNNGKGRVYGLEVSARHDMNHHFTGWLAYTLSRSERRESGDTAYRLFQYDQTHILTLVGMYQLPRNWQVSSRFRLVSGNPRTPVIGAVHDLDTDEYKPTMGRTYSDRNALFMQLDLRIDKKWIYDRFTLNAYLDIQNITNHANVEGLQYNYNYRETSSTTGIPIYPILGLRGEF